MNTSSLVKAIETAISWNVDIISISTHTITNPLITHRCEEIAWHMVVKTYIKPLVSLFKTRKMF
jgi:hypothetical protein